MGFLFVNLALLFNFFLIYCDVNTLIINENSLCYEKELIMKLFAVFTVVLISSLNLYASLDDISSQDYVKSLPVDNRGDWSSGGGNSLVCFKKDFAKEAIAAVHADSENSIPNFVFENDWIESVEMFDLFEASLPRGIDSVSPNIIEISDSEGLEEYFINRKARFENLIYPIDRALSEGKTLISNNMIRFYNGPVKQHNDIGELHYVDRERCVIQTMAVQKNWNNHLELYIDARLFNHYSHSKLSKAVLFIHEYVYAYSRIKLRHSNSYSTRKMVELIITEGDFLTVDYVARIAFGLGYSSRGYPDESTNDGYVILESPLFEIDVLSKAYLELNGLISKLADPIKSFKPLNFEVFVQRFNDSTTPHWEDFPLNSPLYAFDLYFITEHSILDYLFHLYPDVVRYREERAYYIYDEYIKNIMNKIFNSINQTHYLIDEKNKKKIKKGFEILRADIMSKLLRIKPYRYSTYEHGANELLTIIGNELTRQYLDQKFVEIFNVDEILKQVIER
jgi:hypothetical protein